MRSKRGICRKSMVLAKTPQACAGPPPHLVRRGQAGALRWRKPLAGFTWIHSGKSVYFRRLLGCELESGVRGPFELLLLITGWRRLVSTVQRYTDLHSSD